MNFVKRFKEKYKFEAHLHCQTQQEWDIVLRYFYSKGIIFFETPLLNDNFNRHSRMFKQCDSEIYLYVVFRANRLYYGRYNILNDEHKLMIRGYQYLSLMQKHRFRLIQKKK